MNYFSHFLVKPDTVQLRDYQVTLSEKALNENTLLILPTGLGKTAISLMVIAQRITGERKCVLVAPTKPLCEQHHIYFSKHLPYTSVKILTGELPAAERLTEWNDAQVIIATPQTLENDIKNRVYDFRQASLLVIDEAHRAVGGYAYTFLAQEFQSTSNDPLILGMTASPGGNEDKVNGIKEALFISQVLSRNEESPDVAPYVHEKEIDRLYLDLPEPLRRASNVFQSVISDRVKQIRETGIKCSSQVSMKELNRIKAEATKLIGEQNGTGYQLAAVHAELMKMKHAILVAETQGILPLLKYMDKMSSDGTKSSKRIMAEPDIQYLYRDLTNLKQGEIHPKVLRLPAIVINQLNRYPDSKILIFASFRDTGAYIADVLKHQGVKCSVFTGQSARGKEKGMSQKKQQEVIQRFRDGEFQVLISTSIGEEGLDIPSTDVIINYEPVSSEIRAIQRRGRTGRFAAGRIIELITKDTLDETSLFISLRKEEKMRAGITGMEGQKALS